MTEKGDIMLRRIKYKLLKWLLGDICEKSYCQECRMGGECNIPGIKESIQCFENEVFVQARKVWGLEE